MRRSPFGCATLFPVSCLPCVRACLRDWLVNLAFQRAAVRSCWMFLTRCFPSAERCGRGVVQDAVGRTLAHTCAPNKHPGRPVVFVRQHPRYWGRMCATASLARDHAHSAPPQRGSLLLRKEGTLGSCQETCGASRPHLVVDGRGSLHTKTDSNVAAGGTSWRALDPSCRVVLCALCTKSFILHTPYTTRCICHCLPLRDCAEGSDKKRGRREDAPG